MASSGVRFTKMHGCGNDFVLIDGATQELPSLPDAAWVRAVADRRTGIGCDQLMLATLPSTRSSGDAGDDTTVAAADFVMDLWNADGSRAGMCGNGARCFAVFVRDIAGLTERRRFTAAIPAPPTADGRPAPPRVVDLSLPDNGPASVGLGDAAVLDVAPCGVGSIAVKPTRVVCVDVGNPHVVLVMPSAEAVERADVAGVGVAVGSTGVQAWAPGGCNVGFVAEENGDKDGESGGASAGPANLRLRVWERGCGETLSCGSGSAAAAMAVLSGGSAADLARARRHGVAVTMPGGTLVVTPGGDGEGTRRLPMRLAGPTERVFDGVLARAWSHE